MHFSLYSTGTKISGHHISTGRQLSGHSAQTGNSVTWNTTTVRKNDKQSSTLLTAYGIEAEDLGSILEERYFDLLTNCSVTAGSMDDAIGQRGDGGDDAILEDFEIPSSIEETYMMEEIEEEEEGGVVMVGGNEEDGDELPLEQNIESETEGTDIIEEFLYIKNEISGMVKQTFKLPQFPETDTELSFTRIPNYFGSKFDDVEWDKYATEFYSALKDINKVVTYWLDLIVYNQSRWREMIKIHLKLLNGEFGTEEEMIEELENLRDPSLHLSCKKCLELNPFNLNTGLHFCYYYWIKVIVTATTCYKDLMIYFLRGSTIQNFTKIVRMPGFKRRETGTYCLPHQTSMTMSLCMELNRLRLVCRASKLWPLSPQAYLFFLNEDMCALEFAKNHSLIRSHAKRRSPMVLSLNLASYNKSRETPSQEVQQLKALLERQLEYEKLTGQYTNDTQQKQEHISFKENEHTSKMLLELTQTQGVIPMSALEELVGGLVWRFNTFWHTFRFDAYLDILLDKIALYYLGFHSVLILDDPLFRTKVTEEHKQYGLSSAEEDLIKNISRLHLLEEKEEEEEEEEEEEGEMVTTEEGITSSEEGDIIMEPSKPPAISGQGKIIKEQISHNLLNKAGVKLLGSETYVLNQDFLFYTNCLLSEIHLSKYYRNKYDQAKWEFIGMDEETRRFKWNYFLALRTFFKYWARHRRVTNTDMLRDTAATKYNRLMTTQCEFNWFKYYTSVTLKDTSKLVSTTNSKLIQVLRPFEKEELSIMAGQDMKVLFDYHRVDSRHRGYGDWLRLVLAGSVFASSLPEFTTDNSKYILHHEQTLSNAHWFQKENFPFLWYWGGRYYVYCNNILWYVFDVPHDLVTRIRLRNQSDGENYYTRRQLLDDSPDGILRFKTMVENECALINKENDFDDHVYLENVEDIQPLLYTYLYGSPPPPTKEELFLLEQIGGGGGGGGNEPIIVESERLHESGSSAMDEEVERDCIWQHYRDKAGGKLADYECITSLAINQLEKIQDRCLPEADYDNGDTLYDTLALWAFMAQENHVFNPKLAKSVMEGIVTSCEILLKKSNGKTQKDIPLLQVTPQIEGLLEMVELYERNHM